MPDNLEENNNLDLTQGGILPNRDNVDPTLMLTDDRESTTPKEVMDDLFVDREKLGENEYSFDPTKDYDYSEGANGNINGDRELAPLASIASVVSHINDITSKESLKVIKDMIEKKDTDLPTLTMLLDFLGRFILDKKEAKKLTPVIKDLTARIELLQADIAQKEADNEAQEKKEMIETEEEMIDMLLGITALPRNPKDLIMFGEHLEEMKVFLADKESFKNFIQGFIDDTKNDKRQEKQINEKKIQKYQELLGKFDQLHIMIGQVETIIYGHGADALITTAGEKDMTADKLIQDRDRLADINGVMHMKEDEYKKLVDAFVNPAAKRQVEMIIRAYLLKTAPELATKVARIDISTVDGISVFDLYAFDGTILDNDVRFGMAVPKKDAQGVIIPNQFDYPAASIADVMNSPLVPSWVKKEVFNFNPEAVDKNGQPRKTFSQLLEDFWNSDTWESVKKVFLSLGALNGKFNPESKVELDYLNAKDAIKKERKEHKNDYIDKFKLDPNTDIVAKLNAYKFTLDTIPADVSTSTAAYETTNHPKGEKAFFNALSLEDQIRYLSSPEEKVNIKNGRNTIIYTIINGNGIEEEKKGGLTYTKFKNPGVKTIPSPSTNNAGDNSESTNEESPWKGGNIPNLGNVEVRGRDAEYIIIGEGSKKTTIGLFDGVGYATILDNSTNPPKEIIKKLQLTRGPNGLINGMNVINEGDLFSPENKKEQINLLKDNGIWSLEALIDKKDNKDFPFMEYFITHACVLDIPHEGIQAIMADLQRKVMELSQSFDNFTRDALIKAVTDAKTRIDSIVSGFLETTPPLKKESEKTITDWYTTFKLD